MAWQTIFVLKKPKKRQIIDEKWKKALRPLEEGLRKPLPWLKKRNKFPIRKCISYPLNPRMPTIVVAVPETFFCGYYISNNVKMTCTPRFVFLCPKTVLEAFFCPFLFKYSYETSTIP